MYHTKYLLFKDPDAPATKVMFSDCITSSPKVTFTGSTLIFAIVPTTYPKKFSSHASIVNTLKLHRGNHRLFGHRHHGSIFIESSVTLFNPSGSESTVAGSKAL